MTDMQMQKKLEKEDTIVRNLITQFSNNPIQTIEERYEYVNKSRAEGNFEFFLEIADFLGKNFRYHIIEDDTNYDAYSITAVVYTNYAYDFKFILELARYYQKIKRNYQKDTIVFLSGHLYMMKEIIKKHYSMPDAWEDVKSEWTRIIITGQ